MAAIVADTCFNRPLWAATALPWAMVTVVSGEASLLRGNARLALAEGLQLQADDIVEVGPDTRFVGLEWANGSRAGLGAETRIWLAPRLAGASSSAPANASVKPSADLYLLTGWVKLVASPTAALRLATPYFDAQVSRAAVASVRSEQAAVFAEAGVTSVQRVGTPMSPVQPVNAGELLTLGSSAATKPVLSPSATPEFLKALPRPFVDPLPSRPALLRAAPAPAKRLGDLAYAQARDWLNAEPRLRVANQTRWKPLARQPAFRQGLIADLKAHPEWQPVLFPPPPKPAPVTSTAPGYSPRP